MVRSREIERSKAEANIFDVAVIGAGVNGASLYDRLCRLGYSVALIDKGDFGSGTSQASGMMIWGGLLYLRNFDLRAVYAFSRARDDALRRHRDWVEPQTFNFVPAGTGLFSKPPVMVGLYLYLMLSLFRRNRPRLEYYAGQEDILKRGHQVVAFEEGVVKPSDARFVLQWITRHRGDGIAAVNHSALVGGGFNATDGYWTLDVTDQLAGGDISVRARAVANCAGVWTDEINKLFNVRSPYRHVFSKGVYLLFDRPAAQDDALIFVMEEFDDVITNVPWGPVEMWGPTEELVGSPEGGHQVSGEEIAFLLERRRRWFKASHGPTDVVGLRSGVRPLAVPRDYSVKEYSLNLSRSIQIAADPDRPWLSVYGGKLTGCEDAARQAEGELARWLPRDTRTAAPIHPETGTIAYRRFPGLAEPVPDAAWCRDNEFCCTLESYLRRRTKIGQWVRRCGLGRDDENLEIVRDISLEIANGDAVRAERELADYRDRVVREFDAVLGTA